MAAYTFEAITADQASAFAATDTLTFSTGTATQFTVAFATDGTVSISGAGRSLVFSAAITTASAGSGLSFADGSLIFIGVPTNDTISVSPTAPGALYGGDGNDSLSLGLKGGLIQGNQGADTLQSTGQATIYGGQGDDKITASASQYDFLQGNKGDDLIVGGAYDTILGGQGNDTLSGGGFLNGNLGDDSISGTGLLFGEDGDDTIAANGYGTSADAGAGNDSIVATSGTNTIQGGAGADTIESGAGVDVLYGGAGADQFRFLSGGGATPGTLDQVLDWSVQDTLKFQTPPSGYAGYAAYVIGDYTTAVNQTTGFMATNKYAYVAVQVGADVIVFAAASSGIDVAIDLVGRSLADISASNFV